MGLGQVMGESMNYRGARLFNASLLEYKIPTPEQMPEVEILLVGDDDPEGPFGAKEAGEGPLIATLPAVGNALYDAVGVRFTELPITPDRVVAGHRPADGRRGGPGRGRSADASRPVRTAPTDLARRDGRLSRAISPVGSTTSRAAPTSFRTTRCTSTSGPT